MQTVHHESIHLSEYVFISPIVFYVFYRRVPITFSKCLHFMFALVSFFDK